MRRECLVIAGMLAWAVSPFAVGQAKRGSESAQTGVAAPMFETYQAIFSLLFSGSIPPFSNEKRNSAAAKLQEIGLDKNAASALTSYVGEGMAQQHALTERAVSDMCRRKAEITSKAQLGEVFAGIYAELDKMQERQWGRFEFLDEKNKRALSAYAAKRSLEIELRPTDARAVFQNSPETVGQAIARICKGK